MDVLVREEQPDVVPTTSTSKIVSSSDQDSGSESEADEDECNIRRRNILKEIVGLERQFQSIKDVWYAERSTELDGRVVNVRTGADSEFKSRLSSFDGDRPDDLVLYDAQQKTEEDSIERVAEAAETGALQSYQEEQRVLFDEKQDELEKKIAKMTEENECWQRRLDFWLSETGTRKTKRRSRSPHTMFGVEKRKKAVTTSSPYLVYMLRENDATEDWKLIGSCLPERTAS